MVHAPIAHIQLVHHIHHAHDHLGIVRGVAVDLHIEDMSAACQLMIGSLHLCLMTRTALVIHGHMVGIGIVVAVGDTRYRAEILSVHFRELSTQTFCGGSEHAVVMLVSL